MGNEGEIVLTGKGGLRNFRDRFLGILMKSERKDLANHAMRPYFGGPPHGIQKRG
jgi:hypothetical protein